MNNKIYHTLLMLIALVTLSACGGATPKTSSHQGEIAPLVKPIYIYVDFKDDTFSPVSISSSRENGHTSVLVVNRYGGLSLQGYRVGQEVNCNKGYHHTQSIYCQNDTPFFSNSVGVRFKPYGKIYLSEDNLYDFIDNHNLKPIIAKYNELNRVVLDKLATLEPYRAEKEKIYNEKEAKYTIVINDKSGLYDNSIDFSKSVYIDHNRIEPAHYKLPAYKVGTDDSFFTNEKRKFLDNFEKIKKEFYAQVDKETAYVTASFSTPFSEKYNYNIHEIKTLELDKPYKFIVDINSANLHLNYPILAIKNSNLGVKEGDNNTVRFTNYTNEFLSIKSVSYYFNKDIITETDFDKSSILEIAPQAYVERSKETAQNKFDEALTLEEVTADKLKAMNISYGLAIKYISASSGKVKTLYKTKKTTMLNITK